MLAHARACERISRSIPLPPTRRAFHISRRSAIPQQLANYPMTRTSRIHLGSIARSASCNAPRRSPRRQEAERSDGYFCTIPRVGLSPSPARCFENRRDARFPAHSDINYKLDYRSVYIYRKKHCRARRCIKYLL